MTIIAEHHNDIWRAHLDCAEAKAKLSEVMAAAERSGPQVITRKGRRSVVIVAASEWEGTPRPAGAYGRFSCQWAAA